MLGALTQLGDEPGGLVDQLRDLGFTPEQVAMAAMQLARADELAMPIEPVAAVQELTRARSARGGSRPPSDDGAGQRRKPRVGSRDGKGRLAMDLGEVHGVRARDVVGAIAGEADIPGRAIGGIEILKERTLVEVSEPYVDQVISRMRRFRMRGHWAVLYRVD
jgi:ATP-dependent RNA helicase DeaD